MRIIVILLFVIISFNIYASKARMEGLGQNAENGSFYLPDTRSVFLNPAYINSFNNYIITEWGTVNQADGGDNGVGGKSNPNAEGGFFQESGDFVWGIYLGSKTDINDNWKSINNNKEFLTQRNPIDVFFGGDAGMKWGARFSFATSKNEKAGNGTSIVYEAKHTSMGLGLGFLWENINLYSDLLLKDKSTGANVSTAGTDGGMTYEGQLGLKVGISYNVFGAKIFGQFAKKGFDINSNQAGQQAVKYEQTIITAGFGKIHEVAKNARVITDITLDIMKDEGSDSSSVTSTGSWTMIDGASYIQGQSNIKTDKTRIHLNFGVEADATNWLTLRASVNQDFFLSQNSKNSSTTSSGNDKSDGSDETTDVTAGATFNFGNLKIDGLIGTTGTGFLNTEDILVRTALHYWF